MKTLLMLGLAYLGYRLFFSGDVFADKKTLPSPDDETETLPMPPEYYPPISDAPISGDSLPLPLPSPEYYPSTEEDTMIGAGIFIKSAAIAVTKYPLDNPNAAENEKYTNFQMFAFDWKYMGISPALIRVIFRCPELNLEFEHPLEVNSPTSWAWQVSGWLPDVKPGLYHGYLKLQALGPIEFVDALYEGGATRIPKGPAPILAESPEYWFNFQVKETPGYKPPRAAEPSVNLVNAKFVSPTQVEIEYQVKEPPDWMSISAIGLFDSYTYAKTSISERGRGLHRKTIFLKRPASALSLEMFYGYNDQPGEIVTRINLR